MSSVGSLLRTPPRKRAAPVEIVEFSNLPATPLNLPSLRSPIDSQSVPELDWDDTPQSRDDFPLTPASLSSPSDIHTTPSHIHSTKIRPVKQCASARPRQTLPATPPKSHTSTERHLYVDGCETHKPRLLFPPSLFPASAGEKTGNSGFTYLTNIGFDPSFNFSSQSKRAHRDGLRSSLGPGWVKIVAAKARQSIGTQQEPAQKKAKDDSSKISVKTEYDTPTATLAQAVSIKAEDDLERSQSCVDLGWRQEKIDLRQSTSTGTRVIESAIKSVTIRRFSRILPFNTIERLIEDPGKCVASLVKQTDRRCKKPTKSPVVTQAWLLNKLSHLEAPLDLAAAETYIRELVNMVTCPDGCQKSHRSIATEQLARLLNHSDERRRRGDKSRGSEHEFSRADMGAITVWLEALTRLPAGPKNEPVQLVQQTNTSREDSKSPAASQLQPDSPPVSTKAAQIIVEATQTAGVTPIIKMSQTVQANPTVEAAQTTIESTPIVKMTQTIETTSTTEAAQTTEVTQTIETTLMTEVNPIIKTTQAIEVIPTIEATQTAEEAPIVKMTQTIETTPSTEVTQTTDATPIIKTTQTIETTPTTEVTPIIKTTQIIEVASTNEATPTTEVTPIIKTTQTVEVTPTNEATQTTEVGPIIKVTQNPEATQDPEVTRTIEATPIIKITQTTEATRTAAATWTFDATQIIDVSILKPPSKGSTENQGRRHQKQVVVTKTQSLKSLHQDFEPYFSESIRNLSVEGWVHDQLIRPLLPSEIETEGFVYMFWSPGNFGFVKIGMTSKTTAERLQQWEKQCGHKLEEHVGGEVEAVVRLPHVYRVEALVHAELKDMRIREKKCQKCGRRHKEWFNVSPGHAKKVIKKWSDWMVAETRYEYNGEWLLKNTMSNDEIKALCRPIQEERAVPPPALRRSSRLEAARRMGKQSRKNS